MSWANKTKTPQSGVEEDILTPDLLQVLVGSSEDEVLVWQLPFTNWGLKSKDAVGA